MSQNILIAEMELIWSKIKPVLESIGSEIWSILQRVFTAEEAVIMTQLYGMLSKDAIDLQNTQPGISSKDAEGILKTNAMAALVGLGASLAYTAITVVVGSVLHDLRFPDTTGNAGNVVSNV